MATRNSCREIEKVLKFWIFWILSFLPLTLAIDNNVSDHDLEIMNILKKRNKPYVKSFQSLNGDIIDCVPFHLQPAFDNPLLKNHTFQMQPSSYPTGYSRNHSSNQRPLTQPWHANGRCPEGTTPIRRTTKEDILRAKSIPRFGKKTPRTFPKPNCPSSCQNNEALGHKYEIRGVDEGEFYGAKAGIDVWNPRGEEASEFSLAQIWVSPGDDHVHLHTIEAEWKIYS